MRQTRSSSNVFHLTNNACSIWLSTSQRIDGQNPRPTAQLSPQHLHQHGARRWCCRWCLFCGSGLDGAEVGGWDRSHGRMPQRAPRQPPQWSQSVSHLCGRPQPPTTFPCPGRAGTAPSRWYLSGRWEEHQVRQRCSLRLRACITRTCPTVVIADAQGLAPSVAAYLIIWICTGMSSQSCHGNWWLQNPNRFFPVLPVLLAEHLMFGQMEFCANPFPKLPKVLQKRVFFQLPVARTT